MITTPELLEIGDEVSVWIRRGNESRSVYDDPVKKVSGVICGFDDELVYRPRMAFANSEPGVYYRRGRPEVLLADGSIVECHCFNIAMTDRGLLKSRKKELRKNYGKLLIVPPVRIGDLPETKFWEQDRVRVSYVETGALTVSQIDYHLLADRLGDGPQQAVYHLSYASRIFPSAVEAYHLRYSSGSFPNTVDESHLELVERGNAWKFYHNEPLSFSNVKEEVEFRWRVGQAKEVKFDWDGAQHEFLDRKRRWALEAVKNGLAHGFFTYIDYSMETGEEFLDTLVVRFEDEDLGRRIAQETLRYYDQAPA